MAPSKPDDQGLSDLQRAYDYVIFDLEDELFNWEPSELTRRGLKKALKYSEAIALLRKRNKKNPPSE